MGHAFRASLAQSGLCNGVLVQRVELIERHDSARLRVQTRAGNEPSRARLGAARCLNELGSARPFHELTKEARLDLGSRAGSRAIFWYLSLHYLVN
jgi:hypothetical protein